MFITLKALFVQVAFGAAGYSATPHNLMNVCVDVHSQNAQVSAYVTAWFVVLEVGLDPALGTYETEVVREGGETFV